MYAVVDLVVTAGDPIRASVSSAMTSPVAESRLFDWQVPRGQLTVVVGHVGSGKSSLVAALLGELAVRRGRVSWAADGAIGYVAQRPWLLNATVRDNVLFGSGMHEKRYHKVPQP